MNESERRRNVRGMKDLYQVISDSFSARMPRRVCPLQHERILEFFGLGWP
jgi:hypothetical protein